MATEVKGPIRSDLAIPPGETLLDVLGDRDMSQAELAVRIGVSPHTVEDLCNGKGVITAAIALKLERALAGLSAEFWLTLQSNYDLTLARLAAAKQ